MKIPHFLAAVLLMSAPSWSMAAEKSEQKFKTYPTAWSAGMPLESAMKWFPQKRNALLHFRQMQAAGAVTDLMVACHIYYELDDGGWVSLICTKPDSRAGKSTSPFSGMYVIGPITISRKVPPAPKSLSIPLKLATDEILHPVPAKVRKSPPRK